MSWIINECDFLRESHHNLASEQWDPPEKSWFRDYSLHSVPCKYHASGKNKIHHCLFLERHHSKDRRRNAILRGRFTLTTDIAHQQLHPAPSPGMDHIFEEIPNLSKGSPADSPDLMPSDFYPFEKLKTILAESTEEFLLVIRGSRSLWGGPSSNRSLIPGNGD
jgi:hypothetical protein